MSGYPDHHLLYALTEQEVLLQLKEAALADAQRYYRDDRVRERSIVGGTVMGLVEESALDSQVAEASVHDGEIYIACTCEHPGPDICAHVGAVLLAWVNERPSFEGYNSAHEVNPGDLALPVTDHEAEFRELLGNQTINELRTLARRREIEIRGTRKDPIVNELAGRLCDLEEIRGQIAQIDTLARDMLTYLHLILGTGYGLTSEHIVSGLHRQQSNISRRTVHAQLVDLAQRGLLLTFKQSSMVYYMLPQAVRVCLPPQPTFVAPYPEKRLDQLEIREHPATGIIQSLYAVWTYVRERRPRRQEARQRQSIEDQWPQLANWEHLAQEVQDLQRQRRTPYNLYNVSLTVPAASYRLRSADRNALREQTAHSDEEIEFYYVLLERLGAVSALPGDEIVCRQEVFEQLLSLAPSIQMHMIVHAWIGLGWWSEMDLLMRTSDELCIRRNLMYSGFSLQDLYLEWRAARQTVLRFLSTLPEEQWVSADGFLRAIFEVNPDLLHASTSTGMWWIQSTKTKKQFGTTFEDWRDSVGKFIFAILEGPLAWLGAVGLGYREDTPTGVVALKVTPVGSFALERRQVIVETAPQPAAQGTVTLRDDLSIELVPGQTPTQLHDLLHAIGQLEETTPEKFVYRITADGVLLALEHGQTIERLLARIGDWCGVEIPDTWRQSMAAWSQNYGKLHVYDDITLIELADDYALQELLSNTSLQDHVIYEFSPRLVAIRPEAVEPLLQEMEKRGYTPHVE
jgi:hypothetical protein